MQLRKGLANYSLHTKRKQSFVIYGQIPNSVLPQLLVLPLRTPLTLRRAAIGYAEFNCAIELTVVFERQKHSKYLT